MAYIGNSPGVASQRIVTTFTATSNQTTFTPQSGYTVGYIDVYHNGVRLVNGDDYTASNGTTVVLASGAAADDVVETVAYLPRGLSDGYTKAEADARYMSINEETLPSQTGNSGEFLTTDGTNASWAVVDKTTVGLSNVENKSSETIRGEITSGNVTTGLGYTPVNKAGDTMTGDLVISGTGAKQVSIRGTSAGYTHAHVLLRASGSGRGLGTFYYNEVDGFEWFVGNPYAGGSAFGSDRFDIRRQSSPSAPGQDTSNGTLLLRVDSAGRVTTPYQPVFFAFRNSDYTITGSDVELVYQTAKINIGSHYNTGNGRFTAPISGVYEFAYASIAGNAATVTRYTLAKNGSVESAKDELRLDQVNATSQYATNGEFCRYISLSAGDYVSVFVKNDSGTNTGYGSNAYAYTYFRGRLVG